MSAQPVVPTTVPEALIASAVEELLRFANPVGTTTDRYAREDLTIAGRVEGKIEVRDHVVRGLSDPFGLAEFEDELRNSEPVFDAATQTSVEEALVVPPALGATT